MCSTQLMVVETFDFHFSFKFKIQDQGCILDSHLFTSSHQHFKTWNLTFQTVDIYFLPVRDKVRKCKFSDQNLMFLLFLTIFYPPS